jgi:alpha-1,2-mannosyltransferase
VTGQPTSPAEALGSIRSILDASEGRLVNLGNANYDRGRSPYAEQWDAGFLPNRPGGPWFCIPFGCDPTMMAGDGTLQPPIASRRPSLGYVTLASVVVAVLWTRWGGTGKGIWVDLDVYIRGAEALLHHEQLYSVSVHGLPFTYSPFAALLFVPFQLLGNIDARWVLTAASIGSYVLVVIVCARRLRMNLAYAAIIGMAGLTFEPLFRNILLGQINLLLLALIVVDCFLIPARYRGILIGIAAGIKVLPGAFILYLLLKREWGAALRCAASFAASVAIGAMLAPRDSWLFWSGGFMKLSRFGAAAVIGGDNQSLNGEFMRLSHDLTPSPILTLVLILGIMTLGLVAAKHQIKSGNDVAGLVCIAFASLLASPISWTHHWVWVVPLVLVTVSKRWWIMSWTVGIVFLIGPMWHVPQGHYAELNHYWWQAILCASYILVGTGILVRFLLIAQRETPIAGGGVDRDEKSHEPRQVSILTPGSETIR